MKIIKRHCKSSAIACLRSTVIALVLAALCMVATSGCHQLPLHDSADVDEFENDDIQWDKVKLDEIPWHKFKLGDLWYNCLKPDDADKLEKAIELGMPVNAIYDCYGNYDIRVTKCFRHPEQSYPSGTPILYALGCRATNCVQVLLRHNADVSQVNSYGSNAMMCLAGLPEAVVIDYAEKIMDLHHFDVNATNSWGRTALCAAVNNNNAVYAKWLIERGANYNALSAYNKGEAKRLRPIVFDVMKADKDVFELFANLPDVRFDALDTQGNGILKYLKPKHEDYRERLEFLIDKGVAPSDQARGGSDSSGGVRHFEDF